MLCVVFTYVFALIVDILWNTLLDIFDECWMCPITLNQFLLTNFAGFEKRKKAKPLWQRVVYAIVWCIWSKHNSCTFNDRFSDKQILWDKIRCLPLFGVKHMVFFRGISLSNMLRD